MDYYDDSPLKVNTHNHLYTCIKGIRKVERKARKALKTQQMAELLSQQNIRSKVALETHEMEEWKSKKLSSYDIRDRFDWEEFE